MISNVLTRVPSAGKFQSAAEVAASTHAFCHCYTRKPSPTFRFTVSPIIQTRIKKKRLLQARQAYPSLEALVTIGNRPHESLSKLAKTYGPLMTVKFGMIKIVVVSSAEMAREIFQKNDQAFSGRPAPEAVVAEKDYDMSMVWSSGQKARTGKKLRKILQTASFLRLKDWTLRKNCGHMMMQKNDRRVG
ncbi:cytochrome [Sesamum angolense]|uniref:Cytochrome n=1 Tax=Sesamum angolense TaxID=2727404 RepID=A0AAE2BWR0_9LAMI|nr:cytochrome [Sesamum angolense]